MDMDRISKLPPSITEIILCLLPIEEAARTSILSRAWRYQWTKIPKLVFNEIKFQKSTNGAESPISEQTSQRPSKTQKMCKRLKFFNAIYQVLLMHQGPIHEFILDMKAERSCPVIDHILLHLSRKNTVKRIVLNLSTEHQLPSSFFSLHQLTNLILVNCSLRLYLPPSFNRFGSLTSLCLRRLCAWENTVLRLLSRCPLLKELTLDGCDFSNSGDSTIGDLFKCLPVIERLSVSSSIVLFFSPWRLPKVIPTTLVNLKWLRIEYLCFTKNYALPFLVLLIRSSPNLEKLEMQFGYDTWLDAHEMGSFTFEDYSDIMLEHLKEIQISEFKNAKYELDFVKLILAKSPVLKKVRIVVRDNMREYEESQDEESEDEDSTDEESQGEESQGEESQDEESEDEDSSDEESQGEESQGEESQDEELQAWQILEILLGCPCASPVAEINVF